MRRILFIVNPAAGSGKAKNILPLIHKICEENEIEYSLKVSKRKNEITQVVQKELSKLKYTDLVAVGGDGTIIEAINGALDFDINFGLIPMGTGNDLARSLNIPEEPEKAMERIFQGQIESVDLGEVNGTIFVNSAGVGIDGDIIHTTGKVKNFLSGSAAYLLSTVKSIITFKPFQVEMIMDGVKLSRDAYLIAIGNGKYFGGGMKITPDAELSSGEFQVCLVRKLPRLRFLKVFPSVYKGKHKNAPEVEMFLCKHISIQSSDRKLHVSADGNLVCKTPVTIEISKHKLKVWN